MSSENKDLSSLDCSENFDGASMKAKICYSREFLLSLSNLDICRKLPSGFDDSLISEFEDASLRVPDRSRIPGSLSQHGFRRNDYGSSPPTRVDFGSFSRGTGKWESRSSGRSDRDSDSQSDKDSDSGRHYGHPSRWSWRSPEHDGLLGSGSFPRPSGYTADVSAPKVRTNEHNQLSRSTEPYHPPRPYEAVPHSRRDTDAFNDETFGSIDSTSKDRAEEERKRRASFEMMRKEQQKSLHEKQKFNVEKHKPGDVSDLFEVLEDNKEEKGLLIKNNEIAVSAATSAMNNDLEKSFTAQSPPLRPLVPPGFKTNAMEKSSGLKSQIQPPLAKVGSAGKSMPGQGLVDAEKVDQITSDDIVVRQQYHEISVLYGKLAEKPKNELTSNQGEDVSTPGCVDTPIKKPFTEDQLVCLSNDIDSHTAMDDSAITEIGGNVLGGRIASNKNSTSILEKIFGSTLSLNDDQSSLGLIQHLDKKPDDTWDRGSVQTSKFAQWFFEEDTKMADDVTSAWPNNLRSLIAGGDKGNEVSGQVHTNNKDEAFSTVLTCEDLEQSILSEFSAKATEVQPVIENGSSITGTYKELQTVGTDDHASLHLLAMLQKGPDLSNMPMKFCACTDLTDEGLVSGEQNMATAVNEHEALNNSKNLPNLGKTLTLETLFGTAFMKELQSVEAPVSVQRGPLDSAREDASKPHGLAVTDNGFPFSVTDKSGVQTPNHNYSMPSNSRHHAKLIQADNGVGFDDSQIGITSSPNLLPKAIPKHGGHDRFVGFQLPEEDILISSSDTTDSLISSFMQTGNSVNNASICLDAPFNIAEKLAALGSIKDSWGMESPDSLPLSRHSFEQMEPQILHRNLHVQQPSSLLQRQQMSQSSPLYSHLEAHPPSMGSQMNFLHPEPFSRDSLRNQQFNSSLIRPPFHHPSVRVHGYDVSPQHSLLHPMQLSGNHPQHVLPGFPRGGLVPHHGNQPDGFIQEMQGLSLGPHQPNIAGSRFPTHGNPPEAFQRLIEMELRVNTKQIHPLAPGHSQGPYSHEVDMGFQYS